MDFMAAVTTRISILGTSEVAFVLLRLFLMVNSPKKIVMLCVFGNKVLPLHHISLLFKSSSVNQIYYNAYIIVIVFAINGKQRIEGSDGTVGFYSSDS
jgi:hypothetical protein